MAIYHCNIAVASRADGASAVAGAAYLSRSKIECERDGIVHDFTRAHQHERLVADLGVSLPEPAPERWRDRAELWNEVERVERKADAQLARRIECALPDELAEAEQIELARAIVADRVADGHVVDACIHRGTDGHNTHLHMLEPLRRCDGRGFMAKSENAYTVRKPTERSIWADGADAQERERALEDANRKANAAEFRELKDEGFEKVYKYRRGNEWRHLTPTEAGYGENDGFKRQGRNAVQETRYLNNGWNEKERAEEWREAVAKRTNEALARAGEAARVDHRSYERQGIDRVPQLHEGSRVRAIERREERRARETGIEYAPVTDRARENAERRRMSAILEKAAQAREALARAIEGAARSARSAVGSLEHEMAQWRERIDRARAILFQPRGMPEKAVSERQACIYADQSAKRLRGHRERLLDPSHRRTTGGMRDLTERELSFLTPAQAKAYKQTRGKEMEEARAAMAAEERRKAERARQAQYSQSRHQPSYQQSHNPHRGRGR